MRRIELPVTAETIRELHLGDEVLASGVIVTARDAAHKLMVEKQPEWLAPILGGTFIYHCGPVMRKVKGGWEAVAAGPTTSSREEPYQADVIARYGVRGVIGKGGMGPKTLAALRDHGAVYLHAIGGAATLLARRVERVDGVRLLDELGMPEAFWLLRVCDFPLVVTMDSHGNSLHAKVLEHSRSMAAGMLQG